MTEKAYTWYVDRAEHYLAIDCSEISLWIDDNFVLENCPWHLVTDIKTTKIEEISFDYSRRFTITFICDHECGIKFRWYLYFQNEEFEREKLSEQLSFDKVMQIIPVAARQKIVNFYDEYRKGLQIEVSRIEKQAEKIYNRACKTSTFIAKWRSS